MLHLFRALLLTWHALAVYPDALPRAAFAAAWRCVESADDIITAEALFAVTEHESKLEPCAISYGSPRVDVVDCEPTAERYPDHIVCGYLSAMGSPFSCAAEMNEDGAMGIGASELHEWAGTCATLGTPGIACVLRGHAGGTKCARDSSECTSDQRAFVELFLWRVHQLHQPLSIRRLVSG